MDRSLHARYLDYRELFSYFGRKGMVMLTAAQYGEADAAHAALVAKGEERDDEEEARLVELDKLLLRD